jgi:hypothetical protein
MAPQASLSSFKEQLLGNPLALAIARLETYFRAVEIVIFRNTPPRVLRLVQIIGEPHIVLSINR